MHQTPIALTWEPASGTVDHYNVYLSTDGGPYVLFMEVATASCQLEPQDGQRVRIQLDGEAPDGTTGPVSDPSEEIVIFLNGSETDTDGDGMADNWEVSFGFDPYEPEDGGMDPDGDSLINRDEFLAGTLPTNPDTDGDGVSDGEEVGSGQDPLVPGNSRPVADAGVDRILEPTVVTLDGLVRMEESSQPDRAC